MSHTAALKAVEIRDAEILLHVAKAMGLEYLGESTYTMYDGAKKTGHGFKLPGWSRELVINVKDGEASYDNYNGHWGNQVELDKLCQEYAAESNRRQATAQGYIEQQAEYLENGDMVQTFESLYST